MLRGPDAGLRRRAPHKVPEWLWLLRPGAGDWEAQAGRLGKNRARPSKRKVQAPVSLEENPHFGVPRLLPPPGKSEGRLTWAQQQADGGGEPMLPPRADARPTLGDFPWRVLELCLATPLSERPAPFTAHLPAPCPPAGLASVGGGELVTE